MENKTLTNAQKIAEARSLKDEGNELYKQGDLRTAIKRYHVALLYLKGAESKTALGLLGVVNDEEESITDHEADKEKEQLKFSCYNNLAACLLKRENYEKVITYSTQALEIQPDNVKALFRRGQAYFELRKMDQAREDFEQVTKLNPSESAVRKYTAAIEADDKVHRAKEKKMYSAMFQKMASSS